MAEKKINTVLYDIDQSSDTNDDQKATARANIGAQAELTAGENITIDPETNTISSSSSVELFVNFDPSELTGDKSIAEIDEAFENNKEIVLRIDIGEYGNYILPFSKKEIVDTCFLWLQKAKFFISLVECLRSRYLVLTSK